MSQIIVAQNLDGIVMACENRAIQLDEKGIEISLQINRLLPLTPHCALLISGSAEGRDMGSALKNFLAGREAERCAGCLWCGPCLSLDGI